MLNDLQNYFTLEGIYLWINFGILPFWIMIIFIPNSKIADIVLDHQIPLEICISSNVKSGASEVSIENHPAIALLKSGFKVTLNTDNRLMANTTLSKEFKKAKEFLKLENLDQELLLKNSYDSLFTNL